MTPPPAATHAADPERLPGVRSLPLRRIGQAGISSTFAYLCGSEGWPRLRLLVDIVVLGLASTAALLASPIHGISASTWCFGAGFPLLVLVMLYARSSSGDGLPGSIFDTFIRVIGVVSMAAMLSLAADSLVSGHDPAGLTIRLWLFTAVYLSVARAVLLALRRIGMRIESVATPTLIVGAGVVGERLARRLRSDPGYGLRPIGFLDSNVMPQRGRQRSRLPLLGSPQQLGEAVQRTGARHVILAFSTEPDHVLMEQVRECQQHGLTVSLVPRMFESVNDRATLGHVGGLPLVSLRPVNPRSGQFVIKHAFDRSVALLGLIALAPLFALIAAAVRLTSSGPAFFRQLRVGRDGRTFELLKFRTMRGAVSQAEEFVPPSGCAPGGVEGDDRRTAVGRFLRRASLDELPQLVNVLRGEMSLIGPRPERPEFVAQFAGEVERYEDRHRVKSGITGWAQVCGLRGQTSIVDRAEWDNYYVRNWSLRLDLRILLLTVVEVLRFRDNWQERREDEERLVEVEPQLSSVPLTSGTERQKLSRAS